MQQWLFEDFLEIVLIILSTEYICLTQMTSIVCLHTVYAFEMLLL